MNFKPQFILIFFIPKCTGNHPVPGSKHTCVVNAPDLAAPAFKGLRIGKQPWYVYRDYLTRTRRTSVPSSLDIPLSRRETEWFWQLLCLECPLIRYGPGTSGLWQVVAAARPPAPQERKSSMAKSKFNSWHSQPAALTR